MPDTQNNGTQVDKAITWIERLSELLKKYGLQNIILTAMVTFLVVMVGWVAFNPERMFDKVESIKQKAHTESVMMRIKNEPQIRQNIINLRAELKADRVYILETHNGGSNLSNLPFIYVDLTYAEPRSELAWMEEEYRNVRLSRYPWASEVFRQTFWHGGLDDLEELDPELYHRLKNEGVIYMAAIMMYGTYNPSGVIGVVYTSENMPDIPTIQRVMTRYSSSLSALFNNEKGYR